ncbi:BLOC-1- complex subunit 8 [Dermatophagoides pteronyssinus]|uniref:BLOC-1- complex subunit 8 n=1 Tax=Dermatophagoides pteronyssinus TaxID=6956 RepID=A0ABQ8IT41_DERPT|nr:BLOC-1- complex subunit 8 [Dermatophagoides pteronyssinus]
MFAINQNYDSIDGELVRKAKKTCDKITETIYFQLFDRKNLEMIKNESTLKGLLYDIEYTKESIQSLERSKDSFDNIQRLLKDSIYFKQQADYDENVRRNIQEKLRNTSLSSSESSSSNMKSKDDLKSEKSSLSEANESSQQQQSSTRRIRITNSNRFNRFSTSFDFSHSLPMVASSVSADLRSLINHFTNNNNKDSTTTNNQQQQSAVVPENSSSGSQKSVTTSKSLYTLAENVQSTADDGEDSSTKPESSIEKKSVINE